MTLSNKASLDHTCLFTVTKQFPQEQVQSSKVQHSYDFFYLLFHFKFSKKNMPDKITFLFFIFLFITLTWILG